MTDRENLHRILEAFGGDEMARVRFGDNGGVIFDVDDPVSKALAWFEQLFSAMHDAGGSEAAKQGWAMLHILTISLAAGVNISTDIHHREPRSRGGRKPKPKWEDKPKSRAARAAVLAMPHNAKIVDLMEEMRNVTGDLRVTDVTLRNAIKRIKGN